MSRVMYAVPGIAPRDRIELTKLAGLLHYPGGEALMTDYEAASGEIRRRFERIFAAEQLGD